jgi:uncharacterized repeat protein (TIGR01451 family)
MKNSLTERQMKMKPFGTSTITKWMMRATIALAVASAGATWCLATPAADISSDGPLTHVWVGNDLSCQAQHIFDGTTHEFFPSDVTPGDYGTFIAMGGVLYAPDFVGHDNTAADNTFPNIAFTPVSQTGVSGSGTTGDPFTVVTIVNVTGTALQIQQTDTYAVGDEFFTTKIMLINNGTDTASGVLYRAFDAFLGGSDTGFGFKQVVSAGDNRTEVGCSVNPNNSPADKIEALIPLTGGNNYFQGEFDLVWSAIGSKMPLQDTAATADNLDNGAGISWNFSIPAGSSKIVAHTTVISSPAGLQPLLTSKTADSPTSLVGTQNGYTITITNANAFPVTVSSITDTLPNGFTYVVGSSTSATTSDPATAGQNLTWSGSFSVPGRASISLHFAVTVSTIPGEYLNEAGGTAAQGFNVISTGPTAKITVTGGPAGTNLTVSAATGIYGGYDDPPFSATLMANGNPVAGVLITFKLNGIAIGSATTNTSGVAKSSAVLLVGSPYNAGTYGPAAGTGAEANFAGNASFSASYGNNKLTINKAPLTVSADNKSRLFGFPNPPLTAVYTGFVNHEGDNNGPFAGSGVAGTPIITTSATQDSPVGTYPITIAAGTLVGGNNYDITLNPGTLTVTLCGGEIIGLNGITIGASSALVDSYNSSIGYATHDDSATLLSNGTITLQGAKIHGDLIAAGGSGKVVLQANSLVTGDIDYGSTISLASSAVVQGTSMQQANAPFVAPISGACGSYTQAPTQGNMWITGAYTYDPVKGNLTVSGGGMATMGHGTYCFNNVTVSGGSTLAFSDAVIMNVTGKFTDSGGSLQNPSLIPANLQVFSSYTGSNGVTVSGTSATYMSIYAPGTGVTVSGGGAYFGSLVGKTLVVSGNSQVHQDLDLPCWQ